MKGKPFLIIIIALAALIGLSLVPWSKITNGKIKDFNLIGDVLNDRHSIKGAESTTEQLDPELANALKEEISAADKAVKTNTETVSDTANFVPREAKDPRVDGIVAFEDYTQDQRGLSRLKAALASKSRPARIAVIGDSYIEGDILTMNIRERLQDIYGGSGVGYVPLSSPLTGFRISVRQKCNGWQVHDIRKEKSDSYKWLSGEWFTPSSGASVKYSGTGKLKHLDSWTNTRIAFVAPKDGSITITTDAGTTEYPVSASSDVQTINVAGLTKDAEIKPTLPDGVFLGAWLDGNSGIAVDNMSLRGNSGISHRSLNTALAAQLRAVVPYDCIILEYGINALSSSQKDYTAYSNLIQKVIQRIKECYPGSDIILLGIGDRGQKYDGVVSSLPTSPAMVKAQRDAARKTGVIFWDTREAMGGENAVVEWRDRGLINADYIHLNAKGGAALAEIFVNSFTKEL